MEQTRTSDSLDISTKSVENDDQKSTESTYTIKQLNDDASFAVCLAEGQEEECASDAALAMLLQRQFDSEYNGHLKRQEARLNGKSKVGVSLDRFRRIGNFNSPQAIQTEGDCSDTSDNENCGKHPEHSNRCNKNDLAWDVFEESEMKCRSRMMGRSGFVLDVDGNMITKHDIPTSSRRNMCRLMELRTDIETGDAGATKDDFKITNYVYNHLKVCSKKNSRRASQRSSDKKDRECISGTSDIPIQTFKINDASRTIIDRLMITSKIVKFNGVIGHGKESTVWHAIGSGEQDGLNQEWAVKIFKNDLNVAFKTRDNYNKSKCPSYKFDKPRSKNDSLNRWAERGFKNLKSLRKAGLLCPEPIYLKKHVLIMSFLGSNSNPAPQLKVANLDNEQLQVSFNQVVGIMERMYNVCNLVHADLSEYNLLWHENQVHIIDVSQSMDSSHPNANIYLYRDCKNIVEFYRKSGLFDVIDEKKLFTLVCGKDLREKDLDLWVKIEDFPQNEKMMSKDIPDSQIFY